MIKTALESKYIRITIAIFVAILVVGVILIETVGKERSAMVDDGTFRYSLFAPKNVEVVHQSGNYTLMGDGEWYYIMDNKGKTLYGSSEKPIMLDMEGYIRVYKDDKYNIINIYTGDTVWKAKDEEYINDYWGGYWIVEESIYKDKDAAIMTGTTVYYLLDDNFEVAADGALFSDITGNDKYIAGQMYMEYTYQLRQTLAGKMHTETKTENVVLKDGEVYFVSEDHIDHIDGDAAHLSNMTEDRKTHISLLPETLGEEMRGECYEDDR